MDASENETKTETRCLTVEGKIGPVRFSINPVVTILSAVTIWTFVIVCMCAPKEALIAMTSVKSWITTTSTWFYIGTKSIWVVFIAVVYFSKYSKIKLGKDDDEPEFNDFSYFTMLFAAGVGIGLFYFGVAEPVLHYEPKPNRNRYWGRYSDNQRAQDAMNITFYHWGLHAWVVYVVVGLLLAYVGHRKGLPMTIRSCFHPLIGDNVYGLVGDLIDTLSVVGTMFGVCTSLGIGVMSINTGLNLVNSNLTEGTSVQIIIIWVITAMATISVVTGVKLGIRRLSEICFAIGMFLMLFVLFRGDTWYFLNVYVQGIGYYLQYTVQMGSHTDAYAQSGNAPDEKEDPKWMEAWTIFYWGWWISWSPYVGMFIAKISRGRTIRNFLTYTLTAPILYTFLWFSIFGGAGLTMEREAALKGINCSSALGGTNASKPFDGLYRLSCRSETQMFFDLMQGYNERLTPFLYVVSLISITLYFVTSSDSGSLVIDCLSANGSPDPPIVQRIFWALTEGACATALLTAGGTDALNALRTVAMAAGLPYTIVTCFMCVATWRAITSDGETVKKKRVDFVTGLFHAFTPVLSWRKCWNLVLAIVVPWLPAGRVSRLADGKKTWSVTITLAILFNSFLLLEVLQVVESGLAYIGWVVLMGFFTQLAVVRMEVRRRFGIEGSMFQDFLAILFLYPFVVDQLDQEMKYQMGKKDEEDGINMNCLEKESSEREGFLKDS